MIGSREFERALADTDAGLMSLAPFTTISH